jgi:hypothetical protein
MQKEHILLLGEMDHTLKVVDLQLSQHLQLAEVLEQKDMCHYKITD